MPTETSDPPDFAEQSREAYQKWQVMLLTRKNYGAFDDEYVLGEFT